MHFTTATGLVLLSFFLLSCGSEKSVKPAVNPAPLAAKTGASSGELLVMSYNLHNLFDATHDTFQERVFEDDKIKIKTMDRNDWEFLPLAQCKKAEQDGKRSGKYPCVDWTDEKYQFKLKTVKEVFEMRKASHKESKYPDIAAFVEVESAKVVTAVQKMLGYTHSVTSDSRDIRGIDVALVFNESKNLTMKSSRQIHLLDIETPNKRNKYAGRTRPILEVEFDYRGQQLFIYVNHWPSLSNPDKNRRFAAARLRSEIEKRRNEYPKASFLALGDFNTLDHIKDQGLHPIHHILLKNGLRDVPPKLFDAKAVAETEGVKVARGSYSYQDQWQDLDRIFFDESMMDKKGLDADVSSFEIYTHEKLLKTCEPHTKYCFEPLLVPKAYQHMWDPNAKHPGYSDHLPVYIKLKYYN